MKVSVRSDLLAAAEKAGIDLSTALEKALIDELGAAEAIDAYNDHVAKHGVFSDGIRLF